MASSPLTLSPTQGTPKIPTSGRRATGDANLRAQKHVPSSSRTSTSSSSTCRRAADTPTPRLPEDRSGAPASARVGSAILGPDRRR
ncbi:MAG: hypothetical protein IPG04_10050 [Polyangiaceae bacterium]|nr:hypothetical protein [Polyangiaceae bacterium]